MTALLLTAAVVFGILALGVLIFLGVCFSDAIEELEEERVDRVVRRVLEKENAS